MKSVDDYSSVELAAALRASVVPLSRVLRRTDSDLTPTQLSVLGAIYRHGPMSMGELAQREGLSPAMISRVVTVLVEAGLVDRRAGESDRRVCRVHVSEAGHCWIDENRTRGNAWLAERLARFDPQARDILAAAVPLLEALFDDDA